jgi:hypothetical protein
MPHRAVVSLSLRTGRKWLLLLGAASLLVSGCNFHYSRGQALELENRWEEAAIEYHLAVIEDPEVEEYRGALVRAQKVVAKENLELYRKFLAKKQFRKAYQRLLDASRQDPGLEAPRTELAKWLRVLVAGRIRFEFRSLGANVSLADEIRLMVRLNTPNPGETIEAEINLDTGTFFAEHLLYDRPDQLLTYYSLNALGLSLVYGRSRVRSFTSREFQRFVSFRTPVLDGVQGRLTLQAEKEAKPVSDHRAAIADPVNGKDYQTPLPNPHYSLTFRDGRILVSGKQGATNFTPRFLYLNKQDRRIFVDFGHYEVQLHPKTRKWRVARLPIGDDDYFTEFSRNIALKPYFLYREGVFAFVANGPG